MSSWNDRNDRQEYDANVLVPDPALTEGYDANMLAAVPALTNGYATYKYEPKSRRDDLESGLHNSLSRSNPAQPKVVPTTSIPTKSKPFLRTKRGIVILVIAVLIVLLAAIGGFIGGGLRKKNPPPLPSAQQSSATSITMPTTLVGQGTGYTSSSSGAVHTFTAVVKN